jgi:hypothetical protein
MVSELVTIGAVNESKTNYEDAYKLVHKERENCRVCCLYHHYDYWNCNSDLCHELTHNMEEKYYVYILLFKKYQAQQASILFQQYFNNL